jgi:bifunctional enzyme CysN/CysC
VPPAPEPDLLRFATAGSVDDGKSTLIGRLLYDTKSLMEDQIQHVADVSERRGDGYLNLALLTDGLRAEREQGITIDVAYRYFATPRRRFIIADTPGHEQYTRNMVTGASTADLSVVLVDAKRGVSRQSRRHAFISSLLGVPHLVVAVNKMDLVDWDEAVFDRIVGELAAFTAKLDVHDVTFIPVSALDGDNVVERSPNAPWYEGPPLLYHLEHVHIASDRNLVDVRFPVQYVIRTPEYRGYAGQVASGVLRPGDEALVLPSGVTTRIEAIDTLDGPLEEAFPPMSVTLRLADELDVSRGDVICRPHNRPHRSRSVEAMVCWMVDEPLRPGRRYHLKHANRWTEAVVDEVLYRIDVDTLHRDATASELGLNDIGRVALRTTAPLVYDEYRRNRATGSFVLVDQATNDTAGGGMLIEAEVGEHRAPAADERSPNVVWQRPSLERAERWRALGQRGATVWLTGLSGAGKSTIARALERALVERGVAAYVLDGDNLRHGLTGDLGFSAEDRAENVRRVAHVAHLFADSGAVAIVGLVSPYRADRDAARELHERDGLDFVEVWVSTPLEVCERRDEKGLYARARRGEIRGLTGVDDPYEPPERADLDVGLDAVERAVGRIVAALGERGVGA